MAGHLAAITALTPPTMSDHANPGTPIHHSPNRTLKCRKYSPLISTTLARRKQPTPLKLIAEKRKAAPFKGSSLSSCIDLVAPETTRAHQSSLHPQPQSSTPITDIAILRVAAGTSLDSYFTPSLREYTPKPGSPIIVAGKELQLNSGILASQHANRHHNSSHHRRRQHYAPTNLKLSYNICDKAAKAQNIIPRINTQKHTSLKNHTPTSKKQKYHTDHTTVRLSVPYYTVPYGTVLIITTRTELYIVPYKHCPQGRNTNTRR